MSLSKTKWFALGLSVFIRNEKKTRMSLSIFFWSTSVFFLALIVYEFRAFLLFHHSKFKIDLACDDTLNKQGSHHLG